MQTVVKSFVVIWIILIICVVSNSYYIGYKISKLKTEITLQVKTIDSLKSELIYKDIEIGRYEIILDELNNKNPKLFDEIIHNKE